MDTLSAGGTIAFAMECREKGILSKEQMDGVDLTFGKAEAIVEMLEKIALRQGKIATLLGEGSWRASRLLGCGSEEYAMHVKGLEFPMHDPRFSWGNALSYSTGARGSCHLSSLSHMFEMGVALPELGYPEPTDGRQPVGVAQKTIHLQHFMSILDSLCVCKFTIVNNAVTLSNFMEWFGLVTGRHLDLEEFMLLGERAFTLKRMINNRRGITRKDDMLPPRMRTLKKQSKTIDFDVPQLMPMLSEYYDLRGWTEEGRPDAQSIERLGLREFAGQPAR
jgi:aldehyde:ferredoxin oxidoreductase